MDNKLTKAHIMEVDSLNDFKWRLDSVYHPLNDKVTWLTKSMEFLADDINIIMKQKFYGETPAWKAWIPMPSTLADDRWIPSTDMLCMPSTDVPHNTSTDTSFRKLIDICFTILEDKLHSF
ncbi:hypothetical protein Rs2_15955 [Raphanus sativus]|nr:hypothetical protein Rs2_15955 [Raphanus sativus]